MGKRVITDWTATGTNSEYKKVLSDIEARIRLVQEGSTDYIEGSGAGSLSNSQWYWDKTTDTLYIKTSDAGDPNSKTMRIYTYFLVFGTWATQAEMANLDLFVKFKPLTSMYMRYVKISVVKKGNPTFTDLKLDLHPELSNYPTDKVLATPENTWTNATINAYENALSEIWFRYDDVPLKADEYYCLVLKATGTFTASSHVGWAKLDLVYPEGFTQDINLITEGPFRFSLIGRNA